MDVADFISNALDQDRGRVLQILNPWTGEEIGMAMRVAGPDSETQRRARIAMMDELADAARPDGTVTAEDRETARINCLARTVLDWDVKEEGRPIALEHRNIVRILRASAAIQAQLDAFAGNRANFAPGKN